ncbi:MAG: S1C family serine protease [Nocardioidaceae bacterium]
MAAAVAAGAVAGFGGAAAYDSASGGGGSNGSGTTALSQPVVSANGASTTGTSVEAVAAKVLPSVVQINVKGASQADSGTGIILSSNGDILTNNHVIAAAANSGSIIVSFNNGKTANAKIIGRDPKTDIAVVRAQGVSGLVPATLGSSADLKVGQEVVAIGSPFGLESTVTSGIVSALNRPVSSSSESPTSQPTVFPAIQTDAAINPGNSGGPLTNMSGQVIGINSAIQTDTASMGGQGGSIGLGFAIPVDLARSIANEIVKGQTVTHAMIGIKVGDASAQGGLTQIGAQVASVVSNSAGDKAGLKTGDVITKVNDQAVSSADGLIAAIRGYRPGDTVTLTYVRGGNTSTTQCTLGSDGGNLTS